MFETSEETVQGLISDVQDPVFVVVPKDPMDDGDLISLFKALETLLTKIEQRLGVEFDIVVEDGENLGLSDEIEVEEGTDEDSNQTVD